MAWREEENVLLSIPFAVLKRQASSTFLNADWLNTTAYEEEKGVHESHKCRASGRD